jgi:hypothetical protein
VKIKTAEIADRPLVDVRGCMTGFDPARGEAMARHRISSSDQSESERLLVRELAGQLQLPVRRQVSLSLDA